jgi:hypothetical protein
MDLWPVKSEACLIASLSDIDALFPPELRSSNKREKKDNEYKMLPLFKNNNDTTKSLSEEYERIASHIWKGPKFTLNDRFSKYPHERFLAVMRHKVSPKFKAFKRDYSRLILCIILETWLINSYRKDLLTRATCIFRWSLYNVLLPLARKTNVVVGGQANTRTLTWWEWPDLLDPLSAERVERKSAQELQAVFDATEREIWDQRAIQVLIDHIQKMLQAQAAKLPSGTKKLTFQLAAAVSDPLKELAKVNNNIDLFILNSSFVV